MLRKGPRTRPFPPRNKRRARPARRLESSPASRGNPRGATLWPRAERNVTLFGAPAATQPQMSPCPLAPAVATYTVNHWLTNGYSRAVRAPETYPSSPKRRAGVTGTGLPLSRAWKRFSGGTHREQDDGYRADGTAGGAFSAGRSPRAVDPREGRCGEVDQAAATIFAELPAAAHSGPTFEEKWC